jgi:aminobenzoyl-glutamate transport protein
MSPIVVPLLMRANMAPSFAQFIFMVSDGIGKSLTPLFGYFILMIALLQKYNQNKNNKITIFGMLKIMLPAIILFIIVWLLILSGWYVVGIPLGVGTLPTL